MELTKELLEAYKKQNPEKYAQKFGHLEEKAEEVAEVEVTEEEPKKKKKNG